MGIFLWGVLLVVSLGVLVKAADWFTKGAEKIGLYFGLSGFIVGATIVSIGSSLPEIVTSLMGVFNGNTGFPVDNMIGSNIANCLLVGGIVALSVKTLSVKKELIDVDLPFFFLASGLCLVFLIDGSFTWMEGTISLILLATFIRYTMSSKRGVHEDAIKSKTEKKFSLKWLGLILLGGVGVYFGAKYTINSVTELATIMNISPAIVTMLAVAIGTSLPELVISIQAARAGKHSIALGNIFGSNTFNALAVVGIPSLFKTLTVSSDAMIIGVPFFILATLGFFFTTSDNQIRHREGAALLVIYIAFVGKIAGFI